MKKIITIALSLLLILGAVSSFGISASASDESIQSVTEENSGNLPSETEDYSRLYADAGEIGLDYYVIWNSFPNEVELNYENGIYYVTDAGFTDVTYWSYLDYQTYQLTLVDGKWQCELPTEIYERGGLIDTYCGNWEGRYRGSTKESVFLSGDNEFGALYQVEVMSHLFRIWIYRNVGDYDYTADAYYTFEGELDHIEVSRYIDGYQLVAFYNAEREATMLYDGQSYMLPDGNWYAGSSVESEPANANEKFAGMSLEELVALVPCLIYCGDHQLTEYSCDIGQYCTVCLETTKGTSNHDWAEPNCQAPATCKKCGETKGDRTEHGYDAIDYAPDCENDGYTLYTCRVCGDNYVADEINAFGHTYDAAVTSPTCKDGGYTTYTCCNCGDSYIGDEVDALGHDWIDATEDAPKTCDLCGDTEGEPVVVPEQTDTEPESDTVNEPESESAESTETQTDTDTEPESESQKENTPTSSESEDKSSSNDDDSNEEKSGCGSTISASAAVVIAVSIAALGFTRKKKED